VEKSFSVFFRSLFSHATTAAITVSHFGVRRLAAAFTA